MEPACVAIIRSAFAARKQKPTLGNEFLSLSLVNPFFFLANTTSNRDFYSFHNASEGA